MQVRCELSRFPSTDTDRFVPDKILERVDYFEMLVAGDFQCDR